LEKKAAEQEALEKAKNAQRAAGKLTGLSGRALFEVGGELYEDDDEGEEDWDISRMLATYVSSMCPTPTKADFPSKRRTEYAKTTKRMGTMTPIWRVLSRASMVLPSMARRSLQRYLPLYQFGWAEGIIL
jgi:hypothetical protein